MAKLLGARPDVLIVGDELPPFSFFPGKIFDKQTPEQKIFKTGGEVFEPDFGQVVRCQTSRFDCR